MTPFVLCIGVLSQSALRASENNIFHVPAKIWTTQSYSFSIASYCIIISAALILRLASEPSKTGLGMDTQQGKSHTPTGLLSLDTHHCPFLWLTESTCMTTIQSPKSIGSEVTRKLHKCTTFKLTLLILLAIMTISTPNTCQLSPLNAHQSCVLSMQVKLVSFKYRPLCLALNSGQMYLF